VREAKQALSSIPQTAIPTADRTKFTQLKTHLNALDRAVAGNASAVSPSASAAHGAKSASANANWGTEVAAIDKILTELIGPATGSAASSSAMTSGAAGSETAATGTSGRAASAARATTLDDNSKTQLQLVRRHITELAAAMSGAPAQSGDTAAASSGASPDSTGAQPSASSASASSASSSPAEPAASAQSPTTTPASGTGTETAAGASSAQPPTASPSASAQGHVDPTAAKQALSEARDSLSQLTSLPEASRLQGENRTQVSQLIANFNELITTQSNWSASYAKVDANLNALLGTGGMDAYASAAMPSPTPTSPDPTATPGAVGTAGTAKADLDPAIRAKLVDLRRNLDEFHKAAGPAK